MVFLSCARAQGCAAIAFLVPFSGDFSVWTAHAHCNVLLLLLLVLQCASRPDFLRAVWLTNTSWDLETPFGQCFSVKYIANNKYILIFTIYRETKICNPL